MSVPQRGSVWVALASLVHLDQREPTRYRVVVLTVIMKTLTRLSLLLFSLCLYASVSFAQGRGKAEPQRIEFKPGTTGTTISDKIKDDQEAEYVLSAKKGQRLTIKLTSTPYRSSVFDIKAPGDADLGLEYDANYTFSKVLPVTGDYLIVVDRPTSSRGTSNYKLVITVK